MNITISWQANGTKILGRIMWIVGFLGTADASTVNLLQKLVGDRLAHFVGPVCLLCGGIVTEMRGRKNTDDIAAAVVSKADRDQIAASAQVVTDVAKTAVAAEKEVPFVKPPETKS